MATKKTAVKKTAAKKTAVKKASKIVSKNSSKATPKKNVVKKQETEIKAKTVAQTKVMEENNNSYIIIDYPVEKETIFGDVYVIRIGASFDGFVEISFNNGEWQPCRFASGYWWFDWMYYKSGDYKITARLIGKDGNVIKVSDVKSCKVS